MATVLVTGGTGFVGAYVAAELVEHGHHVVAFDLSTDESWLANLGVADDVAVVRGDVTDPTAVVRTVRETGATRVVHLAALLTDGAAADPRAALEVNCGGTNNVFEAARTLSDQVERVAWASSAAVYAPPGNYAGRESGSDGDGGDATAWVTEDDLVDPDTLYGATKAYNEHQARVYAENYGVSCVGLRPTVAYGPYRETGGSAFLVDLIEKPAVGEAVAVDYGDQVIDWQYVRDIATAFRKATFTDESALSRRIYNVRGECATVREAAEAVRSVVPDADISVSDEGELPWTQTLDIGPAREDLDYEPAYDLRAGISEYVSVLREERGLDPV